MAVSQPGGATIVELLPATAICISSWSVSGEHSHTAVFSDAGHIREYIVAMSRNCSVLAPPFGVHLIAAGAFSRPCGSPTPVPVVELPMNATSSNQAIAVGKNELNQVSRGVTESWSNSLGMVVYAVSFLASSTTRENDGALAVKAAPSSVQ